MKPENYGEFVEDRIKCYMLYTNSGNIFKWQRFVVSFYELSVSIFTRLRGNKGQVVLLSGFNFCCHVLDYCTNDFSDISLYQYIFKMTLISSL